MSTPAADRAVTSTPEGQLAGPISLLLQQDDSSQPAASGSVLGLIADLTTSADVADILLGSGLGVGDIDLQWLCCHTIVLYWVW